MRLSRFALAATALFAVGSAASAEDWVYLGTYTGGKDGSKGIYVCKFDDKTGKLTEPQLAAELNSPSFLAIHPDNKVLYAVAETSGTTGGGVVAFKIDRKTGALTKLNQVLSRGAGPCHVSVNPNKKFVAVANYGGGSTAVFGIGPDGKLAKNDGFVQHKGSGNDPNRQKEPHAHCTFFHPSSQYVLTADLGTDRVYVFPYSQSKGSVSVSTGGIDVELPPGTGPRHLALAPDAKFGYVCGELNSTVNVIEFGWVKGNKVIQTLSTLPKPTPGNSTAECILSPDGKFVYVSNRGHNSIAVFKVKEDRTLEAAGYITGDIKTPRNFNIDPSGKWMLIASQDGGKVGVWERDPATGGAKETGNAVKVSKCVCVKFVPVEK